MEIEGRVIFDLPLQEGISRAGNPWKKKEWVFETLTAYPKKVKITIFGEERVAQIPLEVGKTYVFSIEIESRDYQGRWYTDVNCFGAREIAGSQEGVGGGMPFGGNTVAAPAAAPFGAAPAAPQGPGFAPAGGFSPSNDSSDDLPF